MMQDFTGIVTNIAEL